MQVKSLGQRMVVAGLFKQPVLQFCLKILVKKCKELWFVFCSHIRVRVEDMSLHRSCCCMEVAGVCFCLGQ